jgi:hypothetical protein
MSSRTVASLKRSVTFSNDACPLSAYDPSDPGLIFGGLYDGRDGHVERSCEARDLLPRRGALTPLDTGEICRMDVRVEREGFDRQFANSAQAANRLAEIDIGGHPAFSDCDQVERVHMSRALRRRHLFALHDHDTLSLKATQRVVDDLAVDIVQLCFQLGA